MILKNKILFVLLFVVCFSNAQTDEVYTGENTTTKKKNTKTPKAFKLKEKLIYGGNFSLWFGTQTLINLTPIIGYKLSDNLQIGAGVIYNYSSVKYYGVRYEQSLYGTHTFARYLIGDNLFLQAQYDRLNQPNYFRTTSGKDRIWVDYYLVGGGFRQPLGNSAALLTTIMYNLSQHELSVYNNPYIQIGIIAGF